MLAGQLEHMSKDTATARQAWINKLTAVPLLLPPPLKLGSAPLAEDLLRNLIDSLSLHDSPVDVLQDPGLCFPRTSAKNPTSTSPSASTDRSSKGILPLPAVLPQTTVPSAAIPTVLLQHSEEQCSAPPAAIDAASLTPVRLRSSAPVNGSDDALVEMPTEAGV
ncbi:hypothetical protein ABZP36_033540 [Zizania latifolia]